MNGKIDCKARVIWPPIAATIFTIHSIATALAEFYNQEDAQGPPGGGGGSYYCFTSGYDCTGSFLSSDSPNDCCLRKRGLSYREASSTNCATC